MSLPPNTVLNGPTPDHNVPFKDVQPVQETPKTQPNGTPSPGYIGTSPRPPPPPLTRVDSRSSLPIRPNFPNQPGVVFRPQQIRHYLPPGQPSQQQFQQRPPIQNQRPPGPGQPNFPQNQAHRPVLNPNYRPPTPFPRPPLSGARPPGVFQQRSVPTFGQQRPSFESSEQIVRSQTLDSTDLNTVRPVENGKGVYAVNDTNKAAMMAMKNRSYSLSTNVTDSHIMVDEERRRSISSVGSLEDRRSISGSAENLDKKSDGDYPSRPESRTSSRMNKILEDEDDNKSHISNKSVSPHTEVSQKSVDFKLTPNDEPKNHFNKSPSPVNKFENVKTEVIQDHKEPELDKVDKDAKETEKVEKPKTEIERKETEKVEKGKIEFDKDRKETEKVDKVKIEFEKDRKETEKLEKAKTESKNLELKNIPKMRSAFKPEGDNDSGVDESTQGNDQSSNGDHSSPRKSSSKVPTRTSSTTPTKNRSLSRGSKSPSLKSPDSNASTPGATEKKKVPMNKVQVGSAPSPNLKVVRSKIGSLDNANYKPGGGKIRIESKKLDFKNASSRIEAKNEKYTPKGGEKRIPQQKLQWNAKSKIGSLENTTHKPKGGDKKIETVKLDFKEKAKSKVGSKDNIKHVPGGGDIKNDDVEEQVQPEIETKKIELNAQSKVGSFENAKHKPGGGEKKIFDDKDYLKQMSAISSENQSLTGSQNSLPSQPEVEVPVADENLNQER